LKRKLSGDAWDGKILFLSPAQLGFDLDRRGTPQGNAVRAARIRILGPVQIRQFSARGCRRPRQAEMIRLRVVPEFRGRSHAGPERHPAFCLIC
jgi:hypothetical protein